MAGLNFNANSGSVSLAAGVPKTIVQIVAPTQQWVRVDGFSLSVKGTNPNHTPIVVELVQQSSAGTSSPVTLVKTAPGISETLRSSALGTFTAEPTGDTVVLTEFVQVAGGGVLYPFPLKRPLYIQGSGRLGMRCTATDATTVVSGRLEAEE